MLKQKLVIFIILLCSFGCFFVDKVYAEPLPEIQSEIQFSVAIFPQSIPIYLYKNISPDANIDVVKLKKYLSEQISHHPYLKLISQSDIETAFNKAELVQTDAFMQAEIDMGYVESFMDSMNYSSAIDITNRVIGNYKKALYQYFKPQLVAQAYQQQAYALIEKYQEDPEANYEFLHPARLAFLELYRLAPYLSMIEGRQSKERVSIYNEALELFLNGEAYRLIPDNDAAQLAYSINADILLFPRIVQDKTGALSIEIDVYQAQSKAMSHFKKTLDFNQQNYTDKDKYVGDIATWMLANTYDCLDIDKIDFSDKKEMKNRFYLAIGATYSVFMRHPTDNFLNNIGGHIFFSYMLDNHFFLRTGAEIQEVIQNKDHDLYNTFEVYQFPIMVGVLKGWDWFRLYTAIGLDFSFSAPFTITSSITCKTFGTDDRECNSDDVIKGRDPFSLMFDIVVGFVFGRDPFHGAIEFFVNPTLYPTESKIFRHEIGARLSLQYWF